jgi:hypothetical protein
MLPGPTRDLCTHRPAGGLRALRQCKGEAPMKRLHVHVSVGDLDQSVGFYSTMFGDPPTIVKTH